MAASTTAASSSQQLSSASNENNILIDLSSLSSKQRIKEYKVTNKDLKSKDVNKKLFAIEKVNKDIRYFLEGDCLPSLLEAIIPKKKTLDSTKLLLECLLNFLEKDHEEIKLSYLCLEKCFQNFGTLDILQNLSEVIIYEEDVKIKKKKKDEPEPPIDPLPQLIKFYGIKAYAMITSSLFKYSSRNGDLLPAFGSIPNLLINLCNTLLYLMNKMEKEASDKTQLIQHCLWILETINISLRYGKDSISLLLSHPQSSSIISAFKTLSSIELLTLSCLNIYDFILATNDGLQAVISSELLIDILNLVQAATTRVDMSQSQSSGDKKGAKPKEKGKNAKGVDSSVPIANTSYDLGIIAVFVKIMNTLTQNSKDLLISNANIIPVVLKFLALIAMNPAIWSICATVHPTKQDPDLSLFLPEVSILLGNLGLVDNTLRDLTSAEGGVRLLLQFLKNSNLILGYSVPPPEPVKGAPVSLPVLPTLDSQSQLIQSQFRHKIEKSLLHLLSIPRDKDDKLVDTPCRWKVCGNYRADLNSLKSTVDLCDLGENITNLGYLLDLLKHNDDDLSNRATRILSSILVSANDSMSCFQSLQLLTTAVSNLTTLVLKHSMALISEIDKGSSRDMNSIESDSKISVMIPNITTRVALAHAIISIEFFLKYDVASILTFSTEEQITALSELLYRCGPTRGKYLFDSSDSSQVVYAECLIPLLDPRSHKWDGMSTLTNSKNNSILLREIIFDILSDIASADSKYRVYTESIPQQPCQPFPASTCACSEESLRVVKLCINPCLAALQCQSTLKLEGDNIIACPEISLPQSYSLHQAVCESALRCLGAMGSIGVRGFDCLYNSIAKAGFGGNEDLHPSFIPAMSLLKDFFAHKVVPTLPTEFHARNPPDPVDSAASWNLPIYTDLQLTSDGKVVTTSSEILYRKDLWPFLTVICPLLGILASPMTASSTMKLVMDVISNFSNLRTISPYIQPAIMDIFSGCLLGLGGAVVITGCIGRYGPLYQMEEDCETILLYILDRGKSRQQYWEEYKQMKLQADAQETLDPKSKNAKKDPSKDKSKDMKGKGKGKGEDEAIILPYEPDPSHIDPNHGPDGLTWATYLNIQCDEYHSNTLGASPLTMTIVSGLINLSIHMISLGININQQDSLGLSPLCHSLILRENQISRALIHAGADLDQIDSYGNPTIKYLYFSLSIKQLNELYLSRSHYLQTSSLSLISSSKNILKLTTIPSSTTAGTSMGDDQDVMSMILAANVDLNVCDNDGNYPLHYATGLGSIQYTLGGLRLEIVSGLHTATLTSSSSSPSYYIPSIQNLLSYGAKINVVNKLFMSILHILSALNDSNAVKFVLDHGASPNLFDKFDYLPFHYAASSCTNNSIQIISLLLEYGIRRPFITIQEFDDQRTGKTISEKYLIDAKKLLTNLLNTAYCPQSITSKRATLMDIVTHSSCIDGLNPLQLSLCGGILSNSPSQRCLINPLSSSTATTVVAATNTTTTITKIGNRLAMYKYLQSLIPSPSPSSSSSSSPSSFPHLIALYLFFLDAKNQGEDLDPLYKEFFPLINELFNDPEYDGDACYTFPLSHYSSYLPSHWTILHLGLLLLFPPLLEIILTHSISLYKYPYVHFIASLPLLSSLLPSSSSSSSSPDRVESEIEEIISKLLRRISLTPVNGTLLNTSISTSSSSSPSPSSSFYKNMKPLHLAVLNNNTMIIKLMLLLPQVDINIIDINTGQTPFHMLIQRYYEEYHSYNQDEETTTTTATTSSSSILINGIIGTNINLFFSIYPHHVIDLVVKDNQSNTVIDLILHHRHIPLLQRLFEYNSIQVLEILLTNEYSLLREKNILICNGNTPSHDTERDPSGTGTGTGAAGVAGDDGDGECENDGNRDGDGIVSEKHPTKETMCWLYLLEKENYHLCQQLQQQLPSGDERDIARIQQELAHSNELLTVIFQYINDPSTNNHLDLSEFHYHECYNQGIVYSNYLPSISSHEVELTNVQQQVENQEEEES